MLIIAGVLSLEHQVLDRYLSFIDHPDEESENNIASLNVEYPYLNLVADFSDVNKGVEYLRAKCKILAAATALDEKWRQYIMQKTKQADTSIHGIIIVFISLFLFEF